nr:hypothetical protein [uncultured Eubacterium sp.]
MYLKKYGYVVPDFKILNVRTKKEYYLEHFGMMDGNVYVSIGYVPQNIYTH